MENKRVILAVALSLAVLVGWNFLFPPAQQAPKPDAAVSQQDAPAQSSPTAPAAKAETLAAFAPTPGKKITIDTPLYTAVINSVGGVLEQFALKNYRETIKPDSPLVNLIDDKAKAKAPLGIILNGSPTWQNVEWSAEGGDLKLEAGAAGTVVLAGRMGDVVVKRELTFSGDSYIIDEKFSLSNNGGAPLRNRLSLTVAVDRLSAADDSYNPTQAAFYGASGLDLESGEKTLAEGVAPEKPMEWGAVMSNYFLVGIVPEAADLRGKAKLEDGVFRVALDKDGLEVPAGGRSDLSIAYFLGPKVPKYLEMAPHKLVASIDYGWFDFVAKPLIKLLHFFYDYVGNYGVAIILLTILIKLIFWPLSQKSYKSMEQMKKLQPLLTQLREKYKDDRQKMNEEMMQLYKTYKVNPAGGCLPMIVQIPVFFGLYQALLHSIELRHASFITHLPFTNMIWLADLSAKDPFYITPLIMGGTMFIQQKMTPAPGDPTQAKVMLFMPVIFTFMFLNFPSGLVIYWLVNNVISIAQQGWMLNKKS
ncbi:membrane protein insertase YidC [Solidesulfovibrio carbinolicus]|uniref:Membrane protein insertase YidC n=1 Tax=Solidesulfovibrio carbinolicus TaxID=296842 RepID=A0A4V0YQM7_9BACT|nr:membrane protein insertase YidC [Solidesulfovibrio carbinolicus]QAZ66842.1 membrane protein insertase YidC [Solidesulfovibrio carbinolicus]